MEDPFSLTHMGDRGCKRKWCPLNFSLPFGKLFKFNKMKLQIDAISDLFLIV